MLEQKNKASETLRPNGQELATRPGTSVLAYFGYFWWVQLGDVEQGIGWKTRENEKRGRCLAVVCFRKTRRFWEFDGWVI